LWHCMEKINRALLGKSVWYAVEEILGKEFSSAHKQSMSVGAQSEQLGFQLAHIDHALRSVYPDPAVFGTFIRLGESFLAYLRRNCEEINHLGSIENRLKPLPGRMAESLRKITRQLNPHIDMRIGVEIISNTDYLFHVQSSSNEVGRSISYFFVGFLKSFCEWMDARKKFSVQIVKDDFENASSTIQISFGEEG